jgi:hypothetical protein
VGAQVDGELHGGRRHAELEHRRRGRVDQQRQRVKVGLPAVGEPHPELAGGPPGRLAPEPARQRRGPELDALGDGRQAERPHWHAHALLRRGQVRRRSVYESRLGSTAERGERRRRPDHVLAVLRQHRLPERRRPPAARQRRADHGRPGRPGPQEEAGDHDRIRELHPQPERPQTDSQHVPAVDRTVGSVPPPGQLGRELITNRRSHNPGVRVEREITHVTAG